jgi:uncharacterized protein (DUF952 family)
MTATHLGTDQHAVPPGPLWTAAPAGAVSVIFHLAAHEDWERASSAGRYTTASLHDDGFIGCSTATQHAAVANARFAGRTDLVLLLIDPDRLASPIRIEPPDTAGAAFPHVDGPVDLDAVFEATLYQPGPDGRFHPHEEASGFAAHGAATLAETKRRAVEAMAGFAHRWWVAGRVGAGPVPWAQDAAARRPGDLSPRRRPGGAVRAPPRVGSTACRAGSDAAGVGREHDPAAIPSGVGAPRLRTPIQSRRVRCRPHDGRLPAGTEHHGSLGISAPSRRHAAAGGGRDDDLRRRRVRASGDRAAVQGQGDEVQRPPGLRPRPSPPGRDRTSMAEIGPRRGASRARLA